MSKLSLNDDGTVTIPLRPKPGADPTEEQPAEVVLPEPSLAQLAACMRYANEADQSMPALPSLGDSPTAEQVVAATDAMRDRSMRTYGDDAPYATAIRKMIAELAGVEVSFEQLPGWTANPTTCRDIISHFQVPLAGQD